MNLLSKETRYVLTPGELETLLAEHCRAKGLASKDQKVNVDFRVGTGNWDDRFGGSPSYSLDKIEIVIKG